MSLKLIELQVAIPRTMDAGKIASEIAQKGLIHQENLSQNQRKKNIEEAKKVTRNQKSENPVLHTKSNENTPFSTKASHPFKGNKIDYSG